MPSTPKQRRFNNAIITPLAEVPGVSADRGQGSSHPKIRAAQAHYWQTFEGILNGNKKKTPRVPILDQPVKKPAVKKPSPQEVMAKNLQRIKAAERYLSDLQADEIGEPRKDGARLHTMESDSSTKTTNNPNWFKFKSGASLETVVTADGREKILIANATFFKMQSALLIEQDKLESQPLPGRSVEPATTVASEWGEEQD